MNQSTKKRLAALEKAVGLEKQHQQTALEAEWIVLYRTRLEGASSWSDAGGHVLWPLDSIWRRKTYCLMMQAQEERVHNHISETLQFCAEHDPYMLDANYPLLEYFLWTLQYICSPEKCFRPLRIPTEICDLLLCVKPEESLHYRPCDWCYECGYGYPASLYGVSHDIKAFMTTRYSNDEIERMAAPYRGNACLVCGGQIVRHEYSTSDRWQHSPANRLRQTKIKEWQAEIEAVELPKEMQGGRFVPHEELNEGLEAAKADFMKRRAKEKNIRVEHRPSVEEILGYSARWR
jgi:hypothetical protein